jgi:hypothetical protein
LKELEKQKESAQIIGSILGDLERCLFKRFAQMTQGDKIGERETPHPLLRNRRGGTLFLPHRLRFWI